MMNHLDERNKTGSPLRNNERDNIIEKVFDKMYSTDDPKNDDTNYAYLESLSNWELNNLLNH